LIGFFTPIFRHANHKINNYNTLHKFYFSGLFFGIGAKNLINIPMKNQVNTIYKQAERLAEITKTFIISGNINRAKKCLAIADQLLLNGSNETKNAISNVYVFSVSTFMELRHCSIANLFPQNLKQEYNKHINTFGV
jgi:hypothetical protein